MRKTIIALFLSIITLCSASCGGDDRYLIKGKVTADNLDGIRIFLVPLQGDNAQTVDSVMIRKGKFRFEGYEKEMKELRIDRHYRAGTQNLLVAAEPGIINVTIGEVSSGGGTPQNDSLQVWKNLTEEYNAAMRSSLSLDERLEIRGKYVERSRQIAKNVGEETVLGGFLCSLFPVRGDVPQER